MSVEMNLNMQTEGQSNFDSSDKESSPNNALIRRYTWKDQTIDLIRRLYPDLSTDRQVVITEVWLEQLEKLDRKARDMEPRTVAYHVHELVHKHPVRAPVKEMRVIKDIVRVLKQHAISPEEFVGPLDLEKYEKLRETTNTFLDAVAADFKVNMAQRLDKKKSTPYRHTASTSPGDSEFRLQPTAPDPSKTSTAEEEPDFENHWEPFKNLKQSQIPVTTFINWLVFVETAPPGARYRDADMHEVVKSAEDVFNSVLALAKSEGIDVDAMLDMDDAAFCDDIHFAIFPERPTWLPHLSRSKTHGYPSPRLRCG